MRAAAGPAFRFWGAMGFTAPTVGVTMGHLFRKEEAWHFFGPSCKPSLMIPA